MASVRAVGVAGPAQRRRRLRQQVESIAEGARSPHGSRNGLRRIRGRGSALTLMSLLIAVVLLAPELCEARMTTIKPKKGDVDASERHKFIHNGEEFDKAPNLFDVNGELKMLPEVESILDFGEVVWAYDDKGKEALRSSRPWGRVYAEGWPNPIQYLRGTFGGPPPSGSVPLMMAEPPDACGALTNAKDIVAKGGVAVAYRGTCTYGTKASNVEEAGVRGLLIVNNEVGNLHPPMPDAPHISIFVGMMTQGEGEALAGFVKREDIEAHLVPMACHVKNKVGGTGGELCIPCTEADTQAVKDMAYGGVMEFQEGNTTPDASPLPLRSSEYLIATYGSKPLQEAYSVTVARPLDACGDLEGGEDSPLRGKMVIVERGGCSFIDKTERVAKAGGAGMIMSNSEELLFRVGCEPQYRGYDVDIPVVLVPLSAKASLQELATREGGSVRFSPNEHVTAEVWTELFDLHKSSSRGKGKGDGNGNGDGDDSSRAATGPSGKSKAEHLSEARKAGFEQRVALLQEAEVLASS